MSRLRHRARKVAFKLAHPLNRVRFGKPEHRQVVHCDDTLVGTQGQKKVGAMKNLAAAGQREALRIREREAETTGSLAAAIFGLSSQLISEDDIPESEVIDVTPVEDLLDEVRSERQALKRLQTGEAVRA